MKKSKELTPEQKKAAAIHQLWRLGNLEWKLHSSQLEVYNSLRCLPPSVRQVVVLISRRFGKSYMGVLMAVQDALSTPNCRIAIIAPSKEHARNIVVPLMKQILEDAPEGIIKHQKSELRWQCANGSEIILAAYETAVEACRGLAFKNIYLEESGLAGVDDYNYIIKSVLMPTLAHSRGKIIHLTTPSKIVDHPLHTETIPKCHSSNSLFVKTIYDNPLLSDEVKEELIEELGGRDSPDTRRELFCEIVRDISFVAVPSFEVKKNVVATPIEQHIDRPWLMSIDFGGVRDKHAVALLTVEDSKVIVVDNALLEAGTPTSSLIKEFRDMLAKHGVNEMACHIYADAPGQLLTDLLQEYNFNAQLPNKSDWTSSLRLLDSAFRSGSLLIQPECELTIKSLVSGQLNKQRNDFARSKDLGHCDLIAALMYANRMSFMMNKEFKEVSDLNFYRNQPDKYYVRENTAEKNSMKTLANLLGKR